MVEMTKGSTLPSRLTLLEVLSEVDVIELAEGADCGNPYCGLVVFDRRACALLKELQRWAFARILVTNLALWSWMSRPLH